MAKTSDAKTVEGMINKSRKGLNLDVIVEKTGMDRKKVYGILCRLKNAGKIAKTKKGSYMKVKKIV